MNIGELLGLYLDAAAQYHDCAGRMADLQGFIARRERLMSNRARPAHE